MVRYVIEGLFITSPRHVNQSPLRIGTLFNFVFPVPGMVPTEGGGGGGINQIYNE